MPFDKDISSAVRRSNNKRIVWEEKDIPSQGYDIPHIQENWVDDDSTARYFRLSQWCLCNCEYSSSGEIPDKDTMPRQALPEDGKFLSTHIIFGSLDPCSSGKPPVAIMITTPQCWMIDRSFHLRGIWVKSSNFDHWYWLKDPSSTIVTTIPRSLPLPSQEVLHTPFRAKLGLFSNIIDLVLETNKGNPFNYEPFLSKRSPERVHRMLSPMETQLEYFRHLPVKSDEDMIAKDFALKSPSPPDMETKDLLVGSYPLINKEPFDLDLLKTSSHFIRHHLVNIDPYLTLTSNFMKGLKAMHVDYTQYLKASTSPSKIAPKFKQFSHEEYILSAIQSERRGSRHPWGELIHDAPIQPNRWIEFIVQYNLSEDVQSFTNEGTMSIHEGKETTLCDTVQCVLRGVEEEEVDNTPKTCCKLTIQLMRHSMTETMMMNHPQYSSMHLCLALRGLASILIPTPTASELVNKTMCHDDITKYHFAEERVSELMNLIIGDYPDSRGVGHVSSMEWMYIIIDCLRRSGPKIMKALFKSKTKESLSPFAMIYKHWLSLAMHRIDVAIGTKTNTQTERRFIQGVMQFIVDCNVINTMNQIIILTKLSVDWCYIVDKTLEFAIANKFAEIIQSANHAKKHLDAIKAGSLSSKESCESSSPVSAMKVAPVTTPAEPVTEEDRIHLTTKKRPRSDSFSCVTLNILA